MSVIKDFNPHSHVGSDGYEGLYQVSNLDFNPHSHVGSDSIKIVQNGRQIISIHTPT